MEQVLLVVQVIIAIGLIGMVLIQRSDSDGFGLGGGSGNNLLSGRSAANIMTRTTAIFAAVFLINSLALGVIAARSHTSSIVETIKHQQQESGAPAVPLAGTDNAGKKPEKNDEKKEAPAVPPAGMQNIIHEAVDKPAVPQVSRKRTAENPEPEAAGGEIDPNNADN